MGVEKCTKADEGIYRFEKKRKHFGNQIKLLFGIRCVISNRFGRREHKFKLFISSELFLIINIVHRSKINLSGSFARKAPLKREVSKVNALVVAEQREMCKRKKEKRTRVG